MKRLAMLLVPLLTAGALTVTSYASDRVGKIQGKGTADMVAAADDTVYGVLAEGDLFVRNNFAIKATVYGSGLASGSASFLFGDEFNNAWGADAITLDCAISSGSVSEDGTVVLQGSSVEVDFDEFGNVIFEELSLCEIIVEPTGSFSLRWCAIPALNVNGHLKVNLK